MDHNTHHLSQAQDSPFTVEPLRSLLGTDSGTSFVEILLKYETNLHYTPLTKATKRYLEILTKNREIIVSTNQKIILFDDYKKSFRNWREKTTTSLSGRHLGRHHSLFTPDGVQYSNENKNFNKSICRLQHNITLIALLNARTLTRWLSSIIIIIIPKDTGTPKILTSQSIT